MNQVEPETIAPPSIAQIQQCVWARYVQFEAAPFEVDEEQAFAVLEQHYRDHPMAEDSECFYFGILAYELAFQRPDRQEALLKVAVRALDTYRRQTTPDFSWDPVEDRFHDAREQLGL